MTHPDERAATKLLHKKAFINNSFFEIPMNGEIRTTYLVIVITLAVNIYPKEFSLVEII